MVEHDTPAAGQHRQPGWYWVRWTPNGFWFPVQWFRGHDGQEFWVGGRAGQPAAEVGSRIREMDEDQAEDNSHALREAQDKISYLAQMLAIKSQEEVERLYIDNALPEGWEWTIRKFRNHPWADCGYAEAHSPHEEPVYKTYGHTPSEAFRNVVDQVRGKVEPCGSEPAQTNGDQREGYTMRDDTPVDSDTIARRLARDIVSKYIALAGTYMGMPHLEQVVDDALVIALAEKEAEIARLKRELANKERETIERCTALAEAEPKEHKSAAMAHPDPMADFVPRATKRAIVKEVMGTLVGKAAADAHGGPAHKAQAEDEIEITPEMIEAGLSGLWQFHPDRQDEREAVCGIFLKMLRARR